TGPQPTSGLDPEDGGPRTPSASLPAVSLPSGTPTDPADAVDLSSPVGDLTAAGATIGSPPYMAPEQWSGDEVGPRADLYALGVLASAALARRRPLAADS